MRRLKYLLFLVLVLVLSSNAQTIDPTCGTVATEEQVEFMNSVINRDTFLGSARISNTSNTVSVPLKFFIIRQSDNSGGLALARVSALIDEVNDIYSSAGMIFFEVEEPTIISSDQYYNLDSSQEQELAGPNDKVGVVNIYVSGALTSGGSSLCGYTRFPPSADRIFLAMSCADNEFGTTAHELGHYFTLYHTHGKTNTGTTDELVNGSNCTIAGDDLCDTAADPNLSGNVSGCSYSGSARDANGAFFAPDPTNIMSYAPNNCRNTFTVGQFERIRNGLESGRDYLNLVYENFTSKFTSDTRLGCSPVTIKFTDLTNNSVSRNWSFPGSDKESSPLKTVFVTYDEPGFYDVTLSVTNDAGQESTVTRENYILVRDPYENLIQSPSFRSFSPGDLPESWSIDNSDQSLTWEYDENSVDLDGGSFMVNNFDYNPELLPQYDNLNFSSFDLRDLKSLTIEFAYAYTHRFFETGISSEAYDTLVLGYKLDCNEDINILFKEGGEELRTTTSGINSYFVPSADDWSFISNRFEISDISHVEDFSSITPVIQNQTGNGNNLYIDQVSLVPDFSLDSVEFFRGNFSNNQTILRWFNPAINSRRVIIERNINNEGFIRIDSIDPSITEYIDDSIPFENSTTIRYRVKNENDVEESSYSVVADVVLTVTGVDELSDFIIYPNPAKNMINISLSEELQNRVYRIDIVNINGKVVLDEPSLKTDSLIDLSTLNNGIYFVRIHTDRTVIKRKILKLK
ncbi:T9SS type A sorting domain-containing protein [Ekhidna sp.]